MNTKEATETLIERLRVRPIATAIRSGETGA
jgi:hypothetical protein